MTHAEPRRVTVVIPAYGNTDGTLRCIASCQEHADPRHTILIVDDASPDPLLEGRIRRLIKGYPSIRYERNPANLGFVRTCNKAVLELDRTENDILLLNADTVVTGGFLEEMLACLYAHPTYAVCSPRSDDATIMTFPQVQGLGYAVPKERRHALWSEFRTHLPRTSLLPTGVGFCMLIRRTVIQAYGLFDEAYGRGYNEENDFCCRIGRHGYASVAANHAFVFHALHGSFAPEEYDALEERNRALLLSRYPEFAERILGYISGGTLPQEAAACISYLLRERDALRSERDVLRGERDAARGQNALVREAADRMEKLARLLRDELDWMRGSRSWKLTAPLRKATNLLQNKQHVPVPTPPPEPLPPPATPVTTPSPAADTSQAGEVALLRALLPPDGPRLVVDVGAYDGEYCSNSLPFIREGWRAILIEPHPESFERLQRLHQGNPLVDCVRKACLHEEGEMPLYLGAESNNTMATLCTEDSAWFRVFRSEESVPVEAVTLTRLLDGRDVPADFSLLLIDAEGMDYEVLLGLDPARYRPRVIVTENYESNPEKHAAKFALLRDRGYALHAAVGVNTVWTRQ
jgi:FkbM family methyltransferase